MNTPDKLSETLVSGKSVGGGRYILNKQLSEHSNSWLAHDEIENKPVALNFLPPEIYRDPRVLEDLRNQINIVRDLSHPNIGNIYELYEAEGEEMFICSEYVEGMNLRALQQMQPNRVFGWTFLAPLLKQIYAAVELIHSHNLIQGAIKPTNIMLDRKGQIKLLDVGIAGILNNPLYAGPPQAGVGGLLPYLSPQQLDGAPPAITDDIYSLGITIYECLTSTVPFHTGDILPQIRNNDPEEVEQRLESLGIPNPVPPIISSLVMACLAKDPATRPQNIETLAKSLEIAELPPPEAPKATQRPGSRGTVEVVPSSRALTETKPAAAPKKPVVAIVAGVATVVIAIGIGVIYFFSKPAPEITTTEGVPIESAPLPAELQEAIAKSQDDALRDEIERIRRLGPAASTQIPQAPLEKETPEEARQRRATMSSAELAKLSMRSSSGPINLFNGLDLENWKGDQNYWSVDQGLITAKTPANAPAKIETALIWEKGVVGDFELHFHYRFKSGSETGGSAALVYRGKRLANDEAVGYQYLTTPTGQDSGMITSRERTIQAYTQEVIAKPASGSQNTVDTVQPVRELIQPSAALAVVKKDDWNEGVIIARGNQITHKINGTLVAQLTDENEGRRSLSGLLALEIHTGEQRPVFFQVRDITLKQLSK